MDLPGRQTLAALEGRPAPDAAPVAASAPTPSPRQEQVAPEPVVEERKQVIPDRPEPFVPARQPDHAEEPIPALARFASNGASAKAAAMPPVSASAPVPSAPAASVGAVQGAHALAPDPVPAPSSYIDRDPSVNKSLLLRLIAGVRGL